MVEAIIIKAAGKIVKKLSSKSSVKSNPCLHCIEVVGPNDRSSGQNVTAMLSKSHKSSWYSQFILDVSYISKVL